MTDATQIECCTDGCTRAPEDRDMVCEMQSLRAALTAQQAEIGRLREALRDIERDAGTHTVVRSPPGTPPPTSGFTFIWNRARAALAQQAR